MNYLEEHQKIEKMEKISIWAALSNIGSLILALAIVYRDKKYTKLNNRNKVRDFLEQVSNKRTVAFLSLNEYLECKNYKNFMSFFANTESYLNEFEAFSSFVIYNNLTGHRVFKERDTKQAVEDNIKMLIKFAGFINTENQKFNVSSYISKKNLGMSFELYYRKYGFKNYQRIRDLCFNQQFYN